MSLFGIATNFYICLTKSDLSTLNQGSMSDKCQYFFVFKNRIFIPKSIKGTFYLLKAICANMNLNFGGLAILMNCGNATLTNNDIKFK